MSVYDKVRQFIENYPTTIAFRVKKHAKIIEKYLNTDEVVDYAFAGQKSNRLINLLNTYVVALTNKRIILGRKRLLFGNFFYSITPDLFNDLKVDAGLFWGQVKIDTVKEFVVISNISKRALSEIETQITQHMIKEKQEYYIKEDNQAK